MNDLLNKLMNLKKVTPYLAVVNGMMLANI